MDKNRIRGLPGRTSGRMLDRFIQQAVMQALQGDWDLGFSDASYGFRPGRSAHQAVERAREHIRAGYAHVVDLDLEKFFDRVNHDILMGLVAKRVADKRLLGLIRGFLTAGVLEGGLVGPTTEGVPQGGPLSPLLSNLMLDVLDKELEKCGHRFLRYADDCNIYVRSRRAGDRVMASVTRFLARRLKLKVNADKSAVDRPAARAFLGFSFTARWATTGPDQLPSYAAQARGLRPPLSFSSSQSETMRRIISGLEGYSGFSARSLSNASIIGLGSLTTTAWVSLGGLPMTISPFGG